MDSQLHAITHLSQASSSDMAAATSSSTFCRALSTGDLIVRDREEEQRVPVAARYSAEERRERIDKYRSKRNQRNFQKKITVCLLQHIYWFGWFQLAIAASSNIRK